MFSCEAKVSLRTFLLVRDILSEITSEGGLRSEPQNKDDSTHLLEYRSDRNTKHTTRNVDFISNPVTIKSRV